MDSLEKIIYLLSEAELGSTWPAQYIKDNVISQLSKSSKKMLRLASWIINLSPLTSTLRTFTLLGREARRRWLSRVSGESMIYDMINLIEFLLLAVYYINPEHASRIGYVREPLYESEEKPIYKKLSTASKTYHEKYDVIIIGSGAGGAPLAWSLSRKGFKTAIFEIGDEPTIDELRDAHPIHRALKYYWDNGLTFTWGKPVISLPFGRVLGGTVTINSGTMFRVYDEVLNKWREKTGVNLRLSDLNNYYDVVEEKLGVKYVPEHLLGNNADVMRKGAEELGVNHSPTRRPIGSCCGMGECAFGCPCNGKRDMRLTFLKEAKDINVDIYTSAEVKKILFKHGSAYGVTVDIGGTLYRFEAKAIVASAGSINTPKLLKRSGVRNRILGQHLHIHPAAGVTAIMRYRVVGWRGTMQSYYVDDLLKEHHTLLLATFPPPGVGYSAGSLPFSELDRYPYMASIGVQSSDDGEGSIFGWRVSGIAMYNISSDDLEKVKEGVKLSSEIFFAAGAEKVFPPIKKTSGVENMSQLREVLNNASPRAYKLSAYHPMSTARMGSDPDAGVVDEGGRVYGYSNLYLSDASILPSTTYINPQLTINAISLLIADEISREVSI